MRLASNKAAQTGDANMASLDWMSLGRLVRRGALEAVAMHFLATAEGERPARARPDAGAGTDASESKR